MGHVVTAAYATLRVLNDLGQNVVTGFYRGAVLPDNVDAADLDRHVRKGMVAEQGTPEADAAPPHGQPVKFDDAGMPVAGPVDSDNAPAAKPEPVRRARPADTKPAESKSGDTKNG